MLWLIIVLPPVVTSASSYYKKRKITIKMHVLAPGRTRQLLCILRKNLSSFPWYKCARWIFFPTKFCQALPNFTGAIVLLWSRTNFCQVWKPYRFCNLHGMKKFLSAPTITELKILSRFLDGPNKFCQSSASGPLVNFLQCRCIVEGRSTVTSWQTI